jgi:hypothetical protein
MYGQDEWLSPARVQKPAYSPAVLLNLSFFGTACNLVAGACLMLGTAGNLVAGALLSPINPRPGSSKVNTRFMRDRNFL